VQRRPLRGRLVDAGREILERHGSRRRTGRREHGSRRRALGARAERGEVASAQRPLARAHRRRRVPLQDLARAPSLVPRPRQVVERHVLTRADVAVRPEHGRDAVREVLGLLRASRGAAARDGLVERAPRADHLAGAGGAQAGGHPQQVVPWDGAERDDERVARDPSAAAAGLDLDGADLPAPLGAHDATVAHDLARGGSDLLGDAEGCDDRRRPDAVLDDRAELLEPLARLDLGNDPPSGRQSVDGGEAARGAREEHAGEIVAREHRVGLHGAGRDDDPPGACPDDLVGADERDEGSLVDTDGRVPFEERDPRRRAELLGERGDAIPLRSRQERLADPPLVRHDHRCPGGGRLARRGQAGGTGADHDDVGVCAPRRPAAGRAAERQSADAGGPADDAFGDRPGDPRTNERLVVEADRHHQVRAVGHAQEVAFDRRPAALAPDRHAVARVGHARPNARAPVDGDQTVRAVAGQAVRAAPAMMLDRAGERPNAGAEQRGGDGVALVEREASTLEADRRHRRCSSPCGG
jgi:hypothetical protein